MDRVKTASWVAFAIIIPFVFTWLFLKLMFELDLVLELQALSYPVVAIGVIMGAYGVERSMAGGWKLKAATISIYCVLMVGFVWLAFFPEQLLSASDRGA